MIVDEKKKKKRISKRIMFSAEWGMLLFVLVLHALLTLGSILKRYSGD